jgi:hypothetical protein
MDYGLALRTSGAFDLVCLGDLVYRLDHGGEQWHGSAVRPAVLRSVAGRNSLMPRIGSAHWRPSKK